MRKLVFLPFIALALLLTASFKETAPKLTIINKTDSAIDEVHIGGSEDILDDDEVLEPNESVTIEFSGCVGNEGEDVEVLLVFEDGEEYSFDDAVCDGDFSWEIKDDGNHSDK